jgi:hypothetical protein
VLPHLLQVRQYFALVVAVAVTLTAGYPWAVMAVAVLAVRVVRVGQVVALIPAAVVAVHRLT